MTKPVLQIIHISDLHFQVGSAPQHDSWIRKTAATLGRAVPGFTNWLLDYWEDGRAGHAPSAQVAFKCFLTGDRLPTDPMNAPLELGAIDYLGCRHIPTWLIDTGDLSSVGDSKSVEAELDWVRDMAKLIHAPEPITLYGNHDAWPEKFPLISRTSTLMAHRDHLRKTFFPGRWPLLERSIPVGTTGNHIDLYAINSVVHDHYYNTRARGRIKSDPHWNSGADQLDELRSAVHQRRAQLGQGYAFRILLIHHPIHYPPQPSGRAPSFTMSLKGAHDVARQLQLGGNQGLAAHLILSGHTHELFPDFEQLPRDAGFANHTPLGNNQLQLIAGSLTKAVHSNAIYTPRTQPHQFQILRFYEADVSNTVWMQRAVVCRVNGSGRFAFRKKADGQVWENCYIRFD